MILITQSLIQEASVTGRYTDMGSGEFQQELDKTWQALQDVKQVLAQHVEQGNVRPIDAIRGFSALSANILGYEEFVPRGQVPALSVFGSG